MSDYKRVPTSAEVFAVIRARHPEMVVMSSASGGDVLGRGQVITSFGFEFGCYPVIDIKYSWDIDPDDPRKLKDEKHEYWLCLPEAES